MKLQATSGYNGVDSSPHAISEAQQPLLSKIAEVDQWVGDRSDRHWAKYGFFMLFHWPTKTHK